MPSWCAFLLIGLLAFPSCSIAQTATEPHVRLKVSRVNPQWFASDSPSVGQERDLAKKYPGKILRWSNLLALKLDNGLFVWLVDMGDATVSGFGCCEQYRLQDYWPDTGTYVVTLNQDEVSQTLLISERTADYVGVTGTPYRNPANGKLFASVMSSDMSGYSAQVWEQTQKGWTQLYDCRDLVYGTEFGEWTGPQTAELRSNTRYKLSAEGGAWKTDACKE